MRIAFLLMLPVTSMIAPQAVLHLPRHFGLTTAEGYSATWTPILTSVAFLTPYLLTGIWIWLLVKTARNNKWVWWFLVLLPFVLGYPGWMIIFLLACGIFPSSCNGVMF